ncbi:MAG: Hsp20/alpha crystallin family protein [Treponema sp.]|nr:Hsp20/alpha crystallin family protein [Treponema sp.]MBQ4235550.1 Hsp20/alpha crystallin family protein [Treponema sp.]MBQ5384026.1 Hsp20/alpha crystallin family protein [Treponema sp.]
MNDLTLFNDLFDGFDEDFFFPTLALNKAAANPKVDVKEDKDAYTLEMDLPGKTDKDVEIELKDNVLTISSETKSAKEEKKDEKNEMKAEKKDGTKWLIKERRYSKFSRSFTLPNDIDSEKISANVKDGVLVVTMPRHESQQPKRIEIKTA